MAEVLRDIVKNPFKEKLAAGKVVSTATADEAWTHPSPIIGPT